jgi:putative transcriptional regulator
MRASILRALLLVPALLGVPAPSAAQAPPPRANGIFLIAKPELADPNFRRTVVLVTQTEDAETIGVIINRPTRVKLAELLPDDPAAVNYREPMYSGGPVMQRVLIAVFRSNTPPPAPAFRVRRDLYLSMHPDNLKLLLGTPGAQYRLYAGFSGWAPRQLESEFERDGWYVLPADPDIVFRKNTEGMWEELLQRALARKTKTRSPAWERGLGPGYTGQCRQSDTFARSLTPHLGPKQLAASFCAAL